MQTGRAPQPVRQRERAVLDQAEAAYIAFVNARLERDAVATNGERLSSAKAKHGKAARRSQIPRIFALRHGVDRVRGQQYAAADRLTPSSINRRRQLVSYAEES